MSSCSPRYIVPALLLFIFVALSASAQDFQGWKQIRSEHFTIVYEPSDEASAQEMYSFCEDVYANVCNYFDAWPAHVEVVLTGRIDMPNGFYTNMPPHINIILTPPANYMMDMDSSSWLRLVLTHELTHYVSLNPDSGMIGTFKNIFGPVSLILLQTGLPGWAIEGITTYLETRLTDGGRGRNPFFETLFRANAIGGRIFTYEEACGIGREPPAGRIYIAGYLMVKYIHERFGEFVFRDIIKLVWDGLDFDYAFEQVTGQNVRNVYDDMSRDLVRRYAGEIAGEDGEWASPRLRNSNYYKPVLLGGNWLMYRSSREQGSAVVLFDPETGEELWSSPAQVMYPEGLSSSPDGEMIIAPVIEQDMAGPGGGVEVHSRLYRISPDGNVPFSRSTGFSYSCVAPDHRVYGIRQIPGGDALVSLDAEGRDTVLFAIPGARLRNPSLSPDGSQLLLEVQSGTDQYLRILDMTTFSVLKQYRSPGWFYHASFTESGRITLSMVFEGTITCFLLDPTDLSLVGFASDPIGAWSGWVTGSRAFYETYTTQGYALKKRPVEYRKTGIFLTEDVPPYQSAALPVSTGSAVGSAYLALPEFIGWIPLPWYMTSAEGTEIYPGVGVMALFASPSLQYSPLRNLAMMDIFFYPEFRQITGDFQFSPQVGPATLFFTGLETFVKSSSGFNQYSSLSFAVSYPLVSRFALPSWQYLSLTAGILGARITGSSSAFAFADSFGSTVTTDILYAAGLGGFASRAEITNPATLFAGNLFQGGLGGFGALVDDELVLGVNAGGCVRFGISDLALQIDTRLGWLSSDASVLSSPAPRGFTTDFPGIKGFAGTAGVSVLYPLADGSVISTFVESRLSWDGNLTVDPWLYAGYGIISDSVTGSIEYGLSIRLDPIGDINPTLNDVRVYILSSYDIQYALPMIPNR